MSLEERDWSYELLCFALIGDGVMRRSGPWALILTLLLSRLASATLIGPYGPGAVTTLHLWHFDDNPPAATDVVLGGRTLNGLNGATFGNPSYPGFGTSVGTNADALSTVGAGTPPSPAPHRPILLGSTSLSNSDGDVVPFSFSSAPGPLGHQGSFTMEALIKFDSAIFDPASSDFRNTANSGSNAGNYPMDILMGEGDADGARNFQFRIDQIGVGPGTVANATSRIRLEFANLHGMSANQSLVWDLPNSGPDAVNNSDWFHVAVAYDGHEATAGNLLAYWTKLDPSYGAAHSLGSPGGTAVFMNNDLLAASAALSIGNEARDSGSDAGEGESFPGWIDEVRISNIDLHQKDFHFVPEPNAALLVVIGVVGLLGFKTEWRKMAGASKQNRISV
jgi:hypothetical protein